jgi:hypothetical protein
MIKIHYHDKVARDNDLNPNNIIRRYMDLPGFVNLLLTKAIYLCRVDLFPDKIEGAFTPSIQQQIEDAYIDYDIKGDQATFRAHLKQGVFISCWTLSADDNMALWKLYGKQNDCIAITSTIDRLLSAMNKYDGKGRLALRRVKYVKHWKNPPIKINPYSRVFEYKSIGYRFEEEVRIILDQYHETLDDNPKDTHVELPVVIDTLIRSVVISPESSKWFKATVQDIVQKYGHKFPVRAAMMSKSII